VRSPVAESIFDIDRALATNAAGDDPDRGEDGEMVRERTSSFSVADLGNGGGAEQDQFTLRKELTGHTAAVYVAKCVLLLLLFFNVR
jgi:hypothetical protein